MKVLLVELLLALEVSGGKGIYQWCGLHLSRRGLIYQSRRGI